MKRYSSIQIVTSSLSRRYYTNNIYPDIPLSPSDFYVVPVMGDRLDLLANDYYGDPSLYWIIASANNLPGDSLVPPPGEQLRIPSSIEDIQNAYININRLR